MESVQQTCAMCCFQSLQMFHPLELKWLSLHDLIVWPRPHFREILLKRLDLLGFKADGDVIVLIASCRDKPISGAITK